MIKVTCDFCNKELLKATKFLAIKDSDASGNYVDISDICEKCIVGIKDLIKRLRTGCWKRVEVETAFESLVNEEVKEFVIPDNLKDAEVRCFHND